MATFTLTPEQIAQLAGNGTDASDKKKFVDVPPKSPNELKRIEVLEFAYETINPDGQKAWAKDGLPRRISRGVELADGTVRGGGNATYGTQTPGGGLHLPFGFETRFRVGGFILKQGEITGPRATDENRDIRRRESLLELAFGLDGTVTDNLVNADDIYKVRVVVTAGANPYFVKISAQSKSTVGFNGLSGNVEYELIED